MDAKEAKEIAVYLNIQCIEDMALVLRAEGYLEALNGPEVGALVEALKRMYDPNGYEIGEDPGVIRDKALAQIEEARK